MALVLGTNCGFLLARPSGNPSGTSLVLDNNCYAQRDIAPAGATKIIEIGFWARTGGMAQIGDLAVYSGDAIPSALVGVVRDTDFGSNTGVWKYVSGLNIAVTPGSPYWIATQIDNTATALYTDRAADANPLRYGITNATAAPDPWSGGTSGNYLTAIYAVYEAASGPSIPVLLNQYRQRRN